MISSPRGGQMRGQLMKHSHAPRLGSARGRQMSTRSLIGVLLFGVALVLFVQIHVSDQSSNQDPSILETEEALEAGGSDGGERGRSERAIALAEGNRTSAPAPSTPKLKVQKKTQVPKRTSERSGGPGLAAPSMPGNILWSMMKHKRQAMMGVASKAREHHGAVKGGKSAAPSGRGKGPRERAPDSAGEEASLPSEVALGYRLEDVFYPMPVNDKEWFEWDQLKAHEYLTNLSMQCRMPWDGLHHSEKETFFQQKPMCDYLNACESELPTVDESRVTMEYAGYIEQYSDQIRYMHMPMLAQLPTGTLMAAWQASPLVIDDLQEHDRLAVEGLDLQHIRLSHSKDKEGYAWTPSKRVPIPQEAALWSPVLHVDTDGRTWLFYSESVGCRKSYICNQCTPRIRHPCHPRPLQETEVCHSDPALWTPGGHIKVITSENPLAAEPKWSPPRLLLSANSGGGIPKVICNRIVVLSTGEWLLPYWREQTTGAVVDGTCKKHEKGEIEVEVMIDGQPAKELKQLPPGSDCYASQQSPCNTGAREYSGVLRSPDGGQTWKARGQVMLPNTNLIEGTLAELRNGTVLMVFRTQIGCLYKSLSHDKGMTWSRARPMNVPNPNSKVHLMRLEPSGHLLLAFNNHRGANTYRGLKNCRGCRSKLHLAMSIDDGESWRHIVSLDDELSSSAIRIHYPCMLQLGRDQRLMITYSRFYLGRKMGLTSPDQGVVVMRLNLKRVLDNLRAVFAPPSAS